MKNPNANATLADSPSPSDALAEALRLLAALLDEGQPLRVMVARGGLVGELVIHAATAGSTLPGEGEGKVEPATGKPGKAFSPIESAIMKVATPAWQPARELAELTGQKCGHWFYAILGNLADRGWLESGRNGYRLPPEEGQA